MARDRIDRVLVARGLAPSRTRARALVVEGRVTVDGALVAKPSDLVPLDASIELEAGEDYVSRGGRKLAGALRDLQISVRGLVVADVGASTGGFSDCVLSQGARRVYAIDVGHDQLHERLRNDPRVVNMQGVNARNLTGESLPEPVDLVLVDASFISLGKLLPALVTLLGPAGRLLVLVKPQFEVGPANVGKRGVVREDTLRRAAVAAVIEGAHELGLVVSAEVDCRLPGPEGNREIFVLLGRQRPS